MASNKGDEADMYDRQQTKDGREIGWVNIEDIRMFECLIATKQGRNPGFVKVYARGRLTTKKYLGGTKTGPDSRASLCASAALQADWRTHWTS